MIYGQIVKSIGSFIGFGSKDLLEIGLRRLNCRGCSKSCKSQTVLEFQHLSIPSGNLQTEGPEKRRTFAKNIGSAKTLLERILHYHYYFSRKSVICQDKVYNLR